MVFTKLLLENALAIRQCNREAVSEPLLSKVASCIPVLPSRYIGKCTARVLKRSDSDADNLQAIKDKNGKKLYDPESIKETVADYYEDLYITRKDNMFDPLWSMYMDDKIEEYEKDRNYEGLWVNRSLSINELNQPIKIKNGKTVPESDNIPNEFIKNGGEYHERNSVQSIRQCHVYR